MVFNMGTLKVQISTNNGASWTDSSFSVTGQVQTGHTSPWTQASVDLSPYIGQTIMLRFHGTTGADYTSDMAIDYVSITDALYANSKNTTLFYENFDANNGGWVASNTSGSTTWTYDTGTTLTSEAGYWRTNPWNNYSTNSSAYLTSPTAISTTGYQNVSFHIDIKHDTDNDPDDGAQIEYTTNAAGTSGWTRLGSVGNGNYWYNDDDVPGIASTEDGWSGLNFENAQSNSKYVEASIADVALDNQATIWFRVRFGSDSSNTDGGVSIDNVVVKGDPMVATPDPTLGPGDVRGDLRLWLKGNTNTSTTTDNTAISSWGDEAFDNDAIAYSTYQPLFKDNATDNLNHNPVIEFTRANQHHMKGKGGYHTQDLLHRFKTK